MKGFKSISSILIAVSALLTEAKVTFKVVSPLDTPYVVVKNTKYEMKVEKGPLYTLTLDNVNAPVDYHYGIKNNEEAFTRTLNKGDSTLNEFLNRSVTVMKHPLLPMAFESLSTLKKSKLYDDTFVSTLYIKMDESNFKTMNGNSHDSTDYKCNSVFYISPYGIKEFNNAKISVSGQSTVDNAKLSYKIAGLEDAEGKELFGRKSIKVRAEYVDPTFLREKTYFDILNASGAPTSQGKYTRVFINKNEIGLFLITDDFTSGGFLKGIFNNGKKFEGEYAVFKADYYPNDGKGAVGDFSYHGTSSNKYDIYYYKGEKKNVSNKKMVEDILVPFIKDISDYPKTKKLNLDIERFLTAMAVEFLAYAGDNFWMKPGNYFIFKDIAKNMWHFIDSDFDLTFGHGDPSDVIGSTIDNYVKISKEISTARPLIDNLRKVSSNNDFLKSAIKRLIQTSFNINVLEKRIDSLASMIKEDVIWDFNLARYNKNYREGRKYGYSINDFEKQINSTRADYPYPLKYWIKERSKKVASQMNISI
ncbi:hypothetical protein PIROE2DRAFT_48887, partial [Piromyces sp. E2]